MSDRNWLRLILFLLALAAPQIAAAQVAGKPPDLGPFEPLREPRFVPAANANFMKDDDRVLGVSENGVAKAYLTHVMAWHHIIHDQLGKMPILATW
jgi:hypothetical protein